MGSETGRNWVDLISPYSNIERRSSSKLGLQNCVEYDSSYPLQKSFSILANGSNLENMLNRFPRVQLHWETQSTKLIHEVKERQSNI